MQAEPDLAGLALEVRILGVNGIGEESGNAAVCVGRSIPWLQDEAAVDVYTSWAVTYRDVIILDAENKVAGIYNLTSNDLGVSANYDALKAMLIHAASSP